MNADLIQERDGSAWEDEGAFDREELRQLKQIDPEEHDEEQPIVLNRFASTEPRRNGLALVWSVLAGAGVVGGLMVLERSGRATFAIGSANPAMIRLSAGSAAVMLLAAAQAAASFLVLPRFGGPRFFDRLLGLVMGFVGLVAGCVATVLALAGGA
jgi:hypothetical protein